MHRHLISGTSGVLLFLVSLVLFSLRQYGIQEAADFHWLGEGSVGRWDQQEKNLVDGMDHSSRESEPEELKVNVAHSIVGKSIWLGEMFIAVKTTKKFHQSRVGLLLDTWISQVKEQVSVKRKV